MDKKTTLEMIAAISNANGTSGFEDEVVAAIRPYAEGLGEITEDCMRNLYIRRKENNGKRPVVQLDVYAWSFFSSFSTISSKYPSSNGTFKPHSRSISG